MQPLPNLTRPRQSILKQSISRAARLVLNGHAALAARNMLALRGAYPHDAIVHTAIDEYEADYMQDWCDMTTEQIIVDYWHQPGFPAGDAIVLSFHHQPAVEPVRTVLSFQTALSWAPRSASRPVASYTVIIPFYARARCGTCLGALTCRDYATTPTKFSSSTTDRQTRSRRMPNCRRERASSASSATAARQGRCRRRYQASPRTSSSAWMPTRKASRGTGAPC